MALYRILAVTQTEALGLHEVSKGTLIKYFWWWALIIKSNPTLWNLFQKLLNASKVLKCFSFYHSIISRWVPAQVRKIQCLQFSNMNWAKKKSVIKRFKEHNHMDSCHRIIRNTGQLKLYSRDFSLDVTCCIETCFVYFWQQKCVKILTYSWKNQTSYLTFLIHYLTFLISLTILTYLTFLIHLIILTYLTILTHYLTFLTHYLTSHNSDSISHFWLIISFLLIIPYLTSHFDSLSHNSYLSHISHLSHISDSSSHISHLSYNSHFSQFWLIISTSWVLKILKALPDLINYFFHFSIFFLNLKMMTCVDILTYYLENLIYLSIMTHNWDVEIISTFCLNWNSSDLLV